MQAKLQSCNKESYISGVIVSLYLKARQMVIYVKLSVIDWLSECYIAPNEQFSIKVVFRSDDDVRFVLHQYAHLEFYSVNSLKQPGVRG